MLPFRYILLIPDCWLLFAFFIAEILILSRQSKVVNLWVIISLFLSGFSYFLLTFVEFSTIFFYGAYKVTPLTNLVKAVITLVLASILIYSAEYRERQAFGNDFYLLAIFSLFGQFLMISGADLLVLYLGLEMMSLSLYGMIARQNDINSSEASLKYYLLGVLASGIFLYGISLIYGATGTWKIDLLSHTIKNDLIFLGEKNIVNPLMSIGLILVLVGIIFKLGAAPFYMWVPDVYQGSKTVVAMLIACSPKLTGLVFAMIFLTNSFSAYAVYWQTILVGVVALSLILGSFLGLIQENIKRLLAYSAIFNQGFILIGLISNTLSSEFLENTIRSHAASLFYALTYLIAAVSAFAIIMLISSKKENDLVSDFNGLSKKNPWLAFLMLITMFSMAGIPPTVGFFSKFLLISTAVNSNSYAIAFIAVFTSLIGVYYYLRIIRAMYFEYPGNQENIQIKFFPITLLTINSFSLLILGIWPDRLMKLCYGVILSELILK